MMKSVFALLAASALVSAESPWDWNGGYPHGGE